MVSCEATAKHVSATTDREATTKDIAENDVFSKVRARGYMVRASNQ
jgi:hypothetical protein